RRSAEQRLRELLGAAADLVVGARPAQRSGHDRARLRARREHDLLTRVEGIGRVPERFVPFPLDLALAERDRQARAGEVAGQGGLVGTVAKIVEARERQAASFGRRESLADGLTYAKETLEAHVLESVARVDERTRRDVEHGLAARPQSWTWRDGG